MPVMPFAACMLIGWVVVLSGGKYAVGRDDDDAGSGDGDDGDDDDDDDDDDGSKGGDDDVYGSVTAWQVWCGCGHE